MRPTHKKTNQNNQTKNIPPPVAKRSRNPSHLLLLALLILVFLTFLLPVHADEPDLITDRPDFTESASTVPKGGWQLEFGYTFENNNDFDLSLHTLGELLIRFAPLEKFELRFGINSYAIQKLGSMERKGFEDMQLGFKWVAIEDTLGILVSTSLPTGSDNFGNSHLQPEIKVVAARDITDFLSLGANVGVGFLREGNETIKEYSASLSVGFSLTSKLGAYLEYYGYYYGNDEGEDLHFLNGGITYLITPTFQLDARIGKSLNKGDSTYFFGIGAAARF